MINSNMKHVLTQKIAELDKRISSNQSYVVEVYNRLRTNAGEADKNGLPSLHATLGGRNRELVEVHYACFANADDYVRKWLLGLEKEYGGRTDQKTGEQSYITLKMLADPICKNYILDFLRRTFYRNYEAYTREKPAETLETVWFGDENHCWGLPITPVPRNGIIENDHSEIRKAPFHYWTLRHILSTGLIDQASNGPYYFHNGVNQLLVFLRSFSSYSNSIYEQYFIDQYINYINNSCDQLNEPLLIPEFRYGDNERYHRWRTDFLVLNSYTNSHVAIELSPLSTHGKPEKWEDEMKKRRDYLRKYNIPIITFTDKQLKSINDCFNQVLPYLQNREINEPIESVLSRITGH